jgi:hypothetical protein
MRHHWVIGVVAGLATVTASATAAAKPLDRGEFRNEFSGVVENFCEVEGLTVEFDAVVEGRFRVNTKGKDGLVYFDEHLDVTNTLTNVDNGNSVTEHSRVLNKDLSVTDNGDGTLTVILLSTGNSTVYDASGKAIGRNPGQIRIEFVVDHNGTPDFPPDDILLSETLVKGSTGRSDDFCEVVVPALT